MAATTAATINTSTTTTTAAEAAQIQTSAAKDLVAAVARAFYDDTTICLVDHLLRCKYLPDGPGMGKRLHLPTRLVRKTLLFLQAEHLVSCESVTAVVVTRDRVRTYRRLRTRKFWYIDLNRAVHTVALRLHLVQRRLERAVTAACDTIHFVCPGYALKACNGHYTELEAQWLEVDEETGKFQCRECLEVHRHNPDPPPHPYVLDVVDTQDERQQAETLLRRFRSQLSNSSSTTTPQRLQQQDDQQVDGQHEGPRPLRPGIFELLQKIRTAGRIARAGSGRCLPVTSNLPSENAAEEYLESRQDTIISTTAGPYYNNGNDHDDDNNNNNNHDNIYNNNSTTHLSRQLFYFRNPLTGEPTALDLETSTTKQAHHRAKRTGSFGQKTMWPSQQVTTAAIRAGLDSIEQNNKYHHGLSTPIPIPTPTTAEDQEPAIPRPAKMTCRQSTPYFLKSEFQNSSHSDGCIGLDEDDDDHDHNDDDDDDEFPEEGDSIFISEQVVAKLNQDFEVLMPIGGVTRTEFMSQFNSELSMALRTGDEDREKSADSYASVPYWEEN
eukprot:CAMPEP_0117036054 /NCGR_PEP_ID=MMETSP0472-20121206/25571_1 /TAXON_ID=693140 ORGANISM="Tiarina fusus, Strain LIS" /NCGR_SAMPLE_ID=MMETSP0472 /ASSEMBLY_ACC=CAM_ASM_000603 /LENGTH=552 /DNA_ID=CAMNT_0004745713 /DNA_START=15 /DNA_END=1673 /DNA_ORIENTATION=+